MEVKNGFRKYRLCAALCGFRICNDSGSCNVLRRSCTKEKCCKYNDDINFIIGVGIVMWVLFGYSLSFAPSGNAFIGDFRWLGLEGVSLTEGYTDGASIPNMVFSAFQMMFAVITPALITGAVAGRMKFKSIFVFTIFWSLIVYYPLAHMVWGQGGLLGADGIGALDFAGGDVVHISSGVSALVLCILLGKRHDYEHSIYRIHNIPTVVLGASLLMFGWFGFNAGSALAADGLAAHAFMTTVFQPQPQCSRGCSAILSRTKSLRLLVQARVWLQVL